MKNKRIIKYFIFSLTFLFISCDISIESKRELASIDKVKQVCVYLLKRSLGLDENNKSVLNIVEFKKQIRNRIENKNLRKLQLEDFHYEVFGQENDETLILIHGLDSAGGTFYNVTDKLAKKFRVIIYDQRGHGRSIDHGTDFSSEVMATDLRMILDKLNIQQAHILGHSMGARTATRFAADNPSRVSSLIIEDMELFSRVKKDITEETLKDLFEYSEKLKESFSGKIFESREKLAEALKPYFGEASMSLTYRRAKENEDGTFELMFRPWVSPLYGFQGNVEDFTSRLQKLTIPILVMQSNPKKGTALTEKGMSHLKENIINGTFVYFENAGHTIHRSDEEMFLNVMDDFLTSTTIK